MELCQHIALGRIRRVVQYPGSQPCVRYGSLLPKHPAIHLRDPRLWQ
jgi:hypothetical protein